MKKIMILGASILQLPGEHLPVVVAEGHDGDL